MKLPAYRLRRPSATPLPRELRSRWWLLPAFLALMTLPTPLTIALLAGTVAVRIGVRATVRTRAARIEQTRVAAALANGAIALGVDASGRAVLLGESALAAHGLVLGATGAGKSTTLLRILSERVRAGAPVVAIDLKGSPTFARELAAAAEAAGRPFRLWTPDGPDFWNPLARGNATELKDKLIASEKFTEPHYQRAAERYVQTAVRCLQELERDSPPSLGRVVELLEPRRLAAAIRDLEPARAARVREYLASLTPDQLSAVRGLGSRLAIITESHTGPYLEPGSRTPIDLASALAGDEVVLFSLNSSTYGTLAAQLGTLAVQDLVSATGHQLATAAGHQGANAAPPRALVAIDEFSALGSDNIGALFARGREAGVSVLLATQELADLDRAARGLRAQVLGNTAVKIAHRQDVPESAAAVALLAGTERVWERSYQLSAGGLYGRAVQGGTLRRVERPIVDPNRVRTLAPGEALVIVKTPQASARIARILRPASTTTQRQPATPARSDPSTRRTPPTPQTRRTPPTRQTPRTPLSRRAPPAREGPER